MAKTNKVCKDCIHFHACQSWTQGILDDTDARPCRNYETVSDAYSLGYLDGKKSKDWISINDMMPELDTEVLVLEHESGYWFPNIGQWDGKTWWIPGDAAPLYIVETDYVRYWLPIPDDPEEADNGH